MEISEKQCTPGGKRLAFAAFPLLLLPALWLCGCEGPQGPQGEGVGELDTQPPTVSFVSPLHSDTVYTDTFTVRASASDNKSVEYVEFYLDGSSEMGQAAARDSTSPYLWTWSFDSTGLGHGIYPLIARAFDPSKNTADTAPLLIHYLSLPTETLLLYFGDGDISYLTIPDKFGDRNFNVRFTPADTCQLLEAHFELYDPSLGRIIGPAGENEPSLLGGADMMVYVWGSTAAGLPELPPLDSLYVAESNLTYLGWNIFDLSDRSLDFRGDFHVGFSLPGALDYGALQDEPRAIPIYIHVDPQLLADPAQHRSSELEPDRGWGTMQSHWEQKFDFHIRVKVRYPSGTVAMLAPSPEIVGGEVKLIPAMKVIPK